MYSTSDTEERDQPPARAVACAAPLRNRADSRCSRPVVPGDAARIRLRRRRRRRFRPRRLHPGLTGYKDVQILSPWLTGRSATIFAVIDVQTTAIPAIRANQDRT